MRKFLSLVLALVMMMSLVTINAGAKEFTDGDDITYREAVDVISTIKVVDGYADGDFKPGNNLTRGAAAKIICNMILGPTTAAELHADTAPYRDVPVTSDFAGYIAYCQKEGIISGYADGSFRPAGTLTGYAFMKMLLGALGYDAEIEGYTGPNWSINVAKKAIGLGLNQSLEKTFNGVEYVTREEAALYAFNTLKADLVEYSSKITANVNGAEVVVGNSNATPQEWESQKTRSDNIYKDGLVQFAEQYFNKLVLTEDMDVFGRPDREWRYDGDDIGAYINMDLFKQEYTTKVTGRDLYDLLGSRTVDEYNFEIRVDGIETVVENKADLANAYFTEANLIRSNTEKIGETGNGVLTQVFVNNDKDVETVWISVINTYLAKASEDYNEKKDEVDYEVWSLEDKNTSSSADPILVKDPAAQSKKDEKETLTVSGEDFDIENVKENDIVLVRVADGAIQEILDPEVIDEVEITSFKKDNWVKADEQYDYASTAMYDDEVLDEYDLTNMKDTTYRIFLDPYGYAIGVEIIEDAAKYVFLTGIDGNSSNLRNKTADGNLIFTDGTMQTAKINMEKSRALKDGFTSAPSGSPATDPYVEFVPAALWNTWCTYTVSSDGVYTLTEVADTDDQMEADDSGVERTGKRTTDKVGQGWDNAELAGTNSAYTTIIDKSHISLNGLEKTTTGHVIAGTGSDLYNKVYGNDDSVYINVSVKKITNATEVNPHSAGTENPAKDAVIINDVDSVATGVQKVSLKAYDHLTLNTGDNAITEVGTAGLHYSYGVYSLFDSDGFVIAAVVVGEDDGVSSKYAYAFNDTVDQETWSKEDKEWTWTKAVIIDGEEVTLTEKGDSLSGLESMRHNNWYEVKFKADETVKDVTLITPVDTMVAVTGTHSHPTVDADNARDYVFCKDPVNHIGALANGTGNSYPKFVGKIEWVENALDDNTSGKVVLFEDMYTDNKIVVGGEDVYGDALKYTLKTAGTSLQVENNTNGDVKGFAVSGNAKTVLVQDKRVINKNNNTEIAEMDSIEYFDGGRAGLERAIKKLNLNNKVAGEYFRGFVSAVFENGVAQTVIIYEKLPNDVNWGGDETPTNIQVRIANGKITVTPATEPGNNATDAQLNAVRSALEKEGYTDIVINFDGTNGQVGVITATKNGIRYNFDHEGLNGAVLTGIAVTTDPTNLTYSEGDAFDPTGMVVTATYDDGTTADVTTKCTFDVTGGSTWNATSKKLILATTDGSKTVTATYVLGNVTKTAATTGTLTVNAKTVTSFTASVTAGTTIEAAFDSAITKDQLTGLSLEVTYDDGTTATIPGSNAGVAVQAGQKVGTKGDQPITIEFGGATATVSVAVEPTTTVTVAGTITDFDLPTTVDFAGKKAGDTISVVLTQTTAAAFDQTAFTALGTWSVANSAATPAAGAVLTTPGTVTDQAEITVTFTVDAVTAATVTCTISVA